MLSRSSLSRNAPRALSAGRRAMASAANPSFQYDVTEAAGVKVANREVSGATGTLALVAKAGSRYQPFPGFADALEKFAFKTTLKRSALRITREVELLGGEISSTHSRENVVLRAKFLANDLPYFTELLAEVASQPKFADHELSEVVSYLLKVNQQAAFSNPENVALDAAHGVAFHRGLGAPVTPSPSSPYEKYLSADALAEYAKDAYAKSNVALVATGPNSADVTKWVGQFFKDLPTGTTASQYKVQPSQASKYFGGEQRIASKTGNAVVIAFPGSSAFGTAGYKAEASVLAALLGGESTIKWTPGFSLLSQATQGFNQLSVSTKNLAYSDAGLFTVTLAGQAEQVGAASKNVVDALKKAAAGEVSSEDIKKATALAKFRALESVQTLETGLEATGSGLIHGAKPYQIGEIAQAIEKVSEQQVKEVAKSFLTGKATLVSVGDVFQLPYAEDLGLTV
ncbi:Cytochrome b-c1 complex subunit 2, mitochondrial [Penicillium brasilianum]|uniref:Cytochrome b-c1 complex subunit 2, mitochondrial n=1 Tax=Penicillium brasilianum TaxID=104259 RepID=A0A0F7TZF5_PENBI|nr:Cytochrome b-c1 complex subunit 2, mitochondrial [Penicillium brasilianum]CEJ62094.1 Putative Ubiquinol-cytochrome c reductase complex core protein 2 (Eurofung) [Penicillium brasilianum]